MRRLFLSLFFAVFLVLFFVFSCRGDKHPEYPYLSYLPDSIPGLERPVSERVTAFVYRCWVMYEQDGRIYDVHGDSIAAFDLDSLIFIDNSGWDTYRVSFTRDVDVYGGLMYSRKILLDETCELYSIPLGASEPQVRIDLFSLSELRQEAAKSRYSFRVADNVRQKFEQAGCVFPPQERGPTWNTAAFARDITPEDVENMSTLEMLQSNVRTMRAQNREMERFGKVLDAYHDSLQQAYEDVISCFIADNRAEAYRYRFVHEVHRKREPQVMECVVLPEKGFAFEQTSGIVFPDLPVYAEAVPLPEWDKDRQDITLRKTGQARWRNYRFVIAGALIPWIEVTRERRTYYELKVAGQTWNFKTSRPVRLLEYRGDDRKIRFSLVNEDNEAILFSYEIP